ncbi:XRE family transcriptional regulator, partial [Clostridioides difficile]
MELDFKFIGQRIKIARIKKKLTQEVLSEKINVSP